MVEEPHPVPCVPMGVSSSGRGTQHPFVLPRRCGLYSLIILEGVEENRTFLGESQKMTLSLIL